MYKIQHLSDITRSGLADMGPALRQAFNARRDDDGLEHVFGDRPRAAIALLTLGCITVGTLAERLPGLQVAAEHVSFPAVLVGAAWALLFRRYLFGSGRAAEDDFPWLAASLIPTVAALVFIAFTARFFGGGIEFLDGAPDWAGIGGVLVAAADSLALAAAVTITVAALCFSRNWKKALRGLAAQLLVFKITVFVMVLVLVEIGIVGPVLAALASGLFGIRIPPWLGDFVDQLSYAALMTLLYLAVIGATWTVCRQQFGQLLRTGDAEILAAVRDMAQTPEQRQKRLERQARKRKLRKPAD